MAWIITFAKGDAQHRLFTKDNENIDTNIIDIFKNKCNLSDTENVIIFNHLPDRHDLPEDRYFVVKKCVSDKTRNLTFYEIREEDHGWIRSNKKRRYYSKEEVVIEYVEELVSKTVQKQRDDFYDSISIEIKDTLSYDRRDIIYFVKSKLNECEKAEDKLSKIKIVYEIYDRLTLIDGLQFIADHKEFNITCKSKIIELLKHERDNLEFCKKLEEYYKKLTGESPIY